MTAPLTIQLRDYFDYVDEHQVAVDIGAMEERLRRHRSATVTRLDPRRWPLGVVAVGAAAALLLAIILFSAIREDAAPDTITDDLPQPTPSVPEDPNESIGRPEDPTLGAAYDVVFDAFAAIGARDWQGFLDHLDPGAIIRDPDSSRSSLLSSPRGDPPGGAANFGFDFDRDGDGLVSVAEHLLVQAHHLALSPIVISGCDSSDEGVRCFVENTEPFLQQAAGVSLDPIPVAVRDERIVAIEVPLAESVPVARHPLGRCRECPSDEATEIIWRALSDEYMSWLGLGTGDQFRAEDPLAIYWFPTVPRIHPDSFEQHRELLPEWLASRSTESQPREALNEYIEMITTDGHPAPVFATATLGTQQEIRAVTVDDTTDLGDCTADARAVRLLPGDPYRFVGVNLVGSATHATHRIEAFASETYFDLMRQFTCIDPAEGDRNGSDAHADYDMASSSAPYLVVVTSTDLVSTTHLAIGGVPAETSVIAVMFADGTSTWQRPLLGLALLETSPGVIGPIRLLDASGNDMLHIELLNPEGWTLIEQDNIDP